MGNLIISRQVTIDGVMEVGEWGRRAQVLGQPLRLGERRATV
jgi:hypothetical protein